ncbi:zinc finger BED domain-containing protein RICESLEEPER 2 [Prunus persica]|uniref:zinc finger BED domain-containing protein RICESLEEPER 2 n=1 Tax=Prunus persica TaxID=3760 RepID=UPI0009AB55D0|nr:zinc finger BED domain-containing protein RICESLEEPER 2 [Prunus persica]
MCSWKANPSEALVPEPVQAQAVKSEDTEMVSEMNSNSKAREQLKKDLSAHRINLKIDTWTSVQNTNYMVLTAHFIDCDWKMHKKVLNFCVIPNHQGNTIGNLIESCLLQWGIKKVLTINADNASANKVKIDWVRYKMNKWNNSQAVLGGKYLYVRCCAHITNSIVSSGLRKLQKSVFAIRNAVRYVRSSPYRLYYFKTSVEKEKRTCKGIVCMDVPTRWNSTYIMLNAALKFKKAFTRMAKDLNNMAYFKEPDEELITMM